ncbi:MAG: hypothetical protein AAF600_03295 [Bacteroidota bacterium]
MRKDPEGMVKYFFCIRHRDDLQQIAIRKAGAYPLSRFEEGRNELSRSD